MPPLPTDLLSTYDREVSTARDVAEDGAQAALTTLAVARPRPFDAMDEPQRALRRVLRARARQLGGGDQAAGIDRLVEEIAYEQWHRLLFARFLAENALLMHPEGVAVTLEECAELAPEEGAEDRWELAARYAVGMLPGIFALDDPAMQVRFAPEYRQQLEQIVTDLPDIIFTSDDGLGWSYQFWQSKKKQEVNDKGDKIGGADIAPVTQLFTEDYMVKFLLHNSLGAWWAARHPDSPLVATFDYLRFREEPAEDGNRVPAAGTFDGWPKTAAEVTVMDPCCGSGHFVVAAFEMLTQMRMEEERLNITDAGDAVIRDNVFGLEIDPRCTQIASFNLALATWKSGGYRDLPLPNIACSGIPVQSQLEEWLAVAGDDGALRWMMERLFTHFSNAQLLGSLISFEHIPVEERMFLSDHHSTEARLSVVLSRSEMGNDPTATLFGAAIEGLARAAELMSRGYWLVATNVPYLTRNKQGATLRGYCEEFYPATKADLATAFVERCRAYTRRDGTYAVVTPQNWLSQVSYKTMRGAILRKQQLHLVSWLGPRAFVTITGEVVKPILAVVTNSSPRSQHCFSGLDVTSYSTAFEKARALKEQPLQVSQQVAQIRNPDERVILGKAVTGKLIEDYAASLQGISPADLAHFGRYFWEVPPTDEWVLWQGGPSYTASYGGRSKVLWWNEDLFDAVSAGSAYIRGQAAWGKQGVAVRQMGDLPCTLYTGERTDTNVAVIVPGDPELVPAIWAFCKSPHYREAVRQMDGKMNVTNATLAKVEFDLEYWQDVATAAGPLPGPSSDDPTQWLFQGDPTESTAALQVAVARLAGYQWPQQSQDHLTPLADLDGLLCLVSAGGRPPALRPLSAFMAVAYGDTWNLEGQRELLAGVRHRDQSLENWLRDGFFKQHCRLFKNRPFIWHIWDGRRGGFSALVNYHKLDAALLEKLIYTYLGDWIRTQQAEVDREVAGAEGRLVAALALKGKLEAILEGEPPYDIYVRWKPLHEQSIGWNPDLNDGVRMNIRPFVTAGVLRRKFTIHWRKDRGKNPDGSVRLNDLHFTRAEKEAARAAARRIALHTEGTEGNDE